jgi:hypothetical protein
MVLYQIYVFGADLKSNMAARIHKNLVEEHPVNISGKFG